MNVAQCHQHCLKAMLRWGHQDPDRTSLIKVLKDETNLSSVEELPCTDNCTSVVIGTMGLIRRFLFHKYENFADHGNRLKKQFLKCSTWCNVHSLYDRYWTPSTKDATRSKPTGNRVQKLCEVGSQYNAPDPRDFFSSYQNKFQLMMYLFYYWSDLENWSSFMGSRSLYIGGGFQEMSKSIVLTGGTVSNVYELESTHEEADTRIILHTSVNKDAANVLLCLPMTLML